jgi:hypothetical protein
MLVEARHAGMVIFAFNALRPDTGDTSIQLIKPGAFDRVELIRDRGSPRFPSLRSARLHSAFLSIR